MTVATATSVTMIHLRFWVLIAALLEKISADRTEYVDEYGPASLLHSIPIEQAVVTAPCKVVTVRTDLVACVRVWIVGEREVMTPALTGRDPNHVRALHMKALQISDAAVAADRVFRRAVVLAMGL